MGLNNINNKSTWGQAASDINTNFATIDSDLKKVKNATTRNKGYFSSDTELKSAFPSANMGDIAYVGSAYPYQTWSWNGSAWEKKNDAGGEESVNLGNYYTKEETDGKFTETDAKLSELGQKVGVVYDVRWRDSRRIYYNPQNRELSILGVKTAPDNVLCTFFDGGVRYNLLDDETLISGLNIESGNTGLYVPKSSDKISYKLSDIIVFNDDVTHDGYVKIAHILYVREVDSSIIYNIDALKFDLANNSNINEIMEIGIYKIAHAYNPYILCVTKKDNKIIQTRTYTDGSRARYYNVQTRFYENGSWSSWINIVQELTENPILRNHSDELKYYGEARLKWDSSKHLLYIYGKNSKNERILSIDILGKTFFLNDSVKSRVITDEGNQQLLLPIDRDNNTVFTLNDIEIHEGTTYDAQKYVKLGHIRSAEGMSSLFISEIDKEIVDEIRGNILIDLHSNIYKYDFSEDVISGANIKSDGVMETYEGRGVLIFRLRERGTKPIINGTVSILAYQWYSSNPDIVNGTNSLGRTASNIPHADAMYCGLIINTTEEYKNIFINVSANDNVLRVDGCGNNSVGESLFANGLRQDLKILGLGNSFMRNSVHFLSQIAKGVGVNLIVGNLYTGGTKLSSHLNSLRNNTNPYEYHKYSNGESVLSLNNQTSSYGLLDERWDVIILHQYQPTSVMPGYEPFEPYLSELIKEIIKVLGYCPKFYINATWAGSLDSNNTYYGYNTELDMWEAVMNANIEASEKSGVMNIIPIGTAIQNARTLDYADSYNRFVIAEGNDYHHLNPAGGFIAACTIYEKIIYPLNKVHCSGTTFRILSDTTLPPQKHPENGIYVTDDNYFSMCQAAIDAVQSPSVITPLSK